MMKKLLCLGSFIAMILAAPGCDRNNIEPEREKLVKWVLNVDSQTRTILDGSSVIWEDDDTVSCVAIYEDDRLGDIRVQTYYNIHPTEINGSSAKIEVTCGSAFTPQYIIYPSSEQIRYSADGTLEIPVPETYTMVRGNIPHASNIAVGTVEQDNVFLRNTMTLMKFEVAYSDDMDEEDFITQIVFSSRADESIAGKMTYNPAENKVTGVNGSSKIYLYPPEDEPYFQNGTYYFPLPSITLSQGFKIKLTRGDGFVADKSYIGDPETSEAGLVLARNKIINLGKTSDWGLTYENTTRTLEAVFADYVAAGPWPFLESDPLRANVCGKGIIGPFHLPDNTDAPFYFFVAKDTGSDSWRTTRRGRRFGGTIHDYMLLPAIPGYRLASVYIHSGAAVKYAITDNPSSGDPTPVAGGEAYAIGDNKEYTFILDGTSSGTAYRIDLPVDSEKNWSAILKFKLTYEKE